VSSYLVLLLGGAFRSALIKCFARFLLFRNAVSGDSGKAFCRCRSFLIKCQFMCMSDFKCGIQGVYVVIIGGDKWWCL